MELNLFERNDRSYIEELLGDPDELDIKSEEYALGGPVRVTCQIRRDGDLARIEGRVEADLAVQCDRCAEPFVTCVSSGFVLVVKRLALDEPSPDESEREDDLDGEEMVFIENAVKAIDIAPYVRDAVILNVPMKLLCSDDCKGLCPGCGANLNVEPCACGTTKKDPRWNSLAGLANDDAKT